MVDACQFFCMELALPPSYYMFRRSYEYLIVLRTLGALLNELVSMIFPPWKLERDPIENHDVFDAVDRTLDVERMEPVDFTDRLEP